MITSREEAATQRTSVLPPTFDTDVHRPGISLPLPLHASREGEWKELIWSMDFSIQERWGCVNNEEGQPMCFGEIPESLSDLEFDDMSTFRPCKH